MTPPTPTREGASALVTELRALALREPGPDAAALARAREICQQLRLLDGGGHGVGERAERVHGSLEILFSRRRWKSEVASVEVLRKEIRGAADRLRVAVEAALHAQGRGKR